MGAVDPDHARLELYLDGPLWVLRGTQKARDFVLSLFCASLTALGVRLAWHKSSRGRELTWIGVNFLLQLNEGFLILACSDKIISEVKEEAMALRGSAGWVGARRVEQWGGKLSWLAGVPLAHAGPSPSCTPP